MTTTQPHFTLNNGVTLPQIGFGVYQTPPEETMVAVQAALEVGYRHIDTAAAYGNEKGVGEALRRSGLDRSDVFVETKVWVTDYGYEQTLHAFEKASAKLGLEQIDLLIDRVRQDHRVLQSTGNPACRRKAARYRRQQLPAGPSGATAQ